MSLLRVEGLDIALQPDRLFPVCTAEDYGFYAGHAPDGSQLLAAADEHILLVAVFEITGDLRERVWLKLSLEENVFDVLQQQFGWESAQVRVKRFRVPLALNQSSDPFQLALVGEDGFAIAPIPLDWKEDINDPESLGEELEDFTAMVQGWVDRGNFALYWGNEYHLDDSGAVVGS